MTKSKTEAAMDLQAPLVGGSEVEGSSTQLAKTDALPSFGTIVEAVKGGGLSSDDVAKLLSVYRELKADKAEQEYNVAFAAFQGECPTIPRKKTAKIATSSGASFSYTYADVETIMETIGPTLAEHGLSVSFEDSKVDGNMLTATCRCSHIGGHSRESSFEVSTETKAGMSPQQKYGAASTYAQRRALSSRLGLWTGDPDDDGGEPPAPPQKLTQEQEARIAALVTEAGQDWGKLLAWWGVANLADAYQDKYEEAVRNLERKKAQKGKDTQ